MRCLAVGLVASAFVAAPACAQQGQAPHAWLFGAWTGGLFPAPDRVSPQTCLGQPVVIFTRDVVLRATLTETTYLQRVIETARTSGGGTEFRFTPAPAQPADILGTPGTPPTGFGCETPDVLHVRRINDTTIAFPGCADFPNPLVRCPSR